jgi:hypothetical protein
MAARLGGLAQRKAGLRFSPGNRTKGMTPAAHYHRGQVHALLTGLAGQALALDLLYFQRLSATPAA